MDGPARRVLAEKLFNRLVPEQPWTARVAASLIAAFEADEAAPLGRAVLAQLGDDAAADFRRQLIGQLERYGKVTTAGPWEIDILVLAIKEVELIACLRAFGLGPEAGNATKLGGGAEAYLVDDGEHRYAIAWVGSDGNVESALRIAALFAVLRFRLAVLVGMAAGVRGAVRLGDVVISEAVWAIDFEVIKAGGGHSPRPTTYRPPLNLYSGMTNMRLVVMDWATKVSAEVEQWCETDPLCVRPPAVEAGWQPRFERGIIFAGSRLIEDGSLPQARENKHARLLAAEMEGAGFAAACDEHRAQADWLVFRGIADFGEPEREKGWQFAATYAAAALLRDAMRNDRIAIRSRGT